MDAGEQWVTKYTLSWSTNNQDWVPIAENDTVKVFDGNTDAEAVKYVSLGVHMPPKPVRYLRISPQEWRRHPALRVEIHGWSVGEDPALPPPPPTPPPAKAAKGEKAKTKSKSKAKAESEAKTKAEPMAEIKVEPKVEPTGALAERPCRLEVIRRKAQCMKKAVEMASTAALEKLKEVQKADAERNKQAMDEKTHIETQLADTIKQLEELRRMHEELQDKAAETEQKLVDTDTEMLKIKADKLRSESEAKALEEKLDGANQSIQQEKQKVDDLTKKEAKLQSANEDLENQIVVLTEECTNAKAKEEELWGERNAMEDELMNTNDGYCRMTEQLHEMREEYDEKVEERDSVIETLNSRTQQLTDEGMTLRKEIGEWKRKLMEAEKGIQRAEQGLPINYRVTMVPATPASQSMMAAMAASSPKPKKEEAAPKKKKERVAYEDDFEESRPCSPK